MKIKVIKNSRELDIPDDATVEELTAILCKWAPYVTMDENKTAYTLTKKSMFDGFPDVANIFSSIFGKK